MLWTSLAWAQDAPPARSAGSNGSTANSVTRAPAAAPVDTATLMQRNGGSLLRASLSAASDPKKAEMSAVSYLSVPEPEPKTIKKHDLVTIIIREESEFSADGSTELKKKADLTASIDEWIKLKELVTDLQLEGGGVSEPVPSVKMQGSRNFKGEGQVERTDSFVTRITAEVADVKPNGTFAIQARKKIKHDEEETEYLLTGVCRAADLTIDNTVLSTQVHNLEIETKHKGAVRDTTKRGLVPKLLDSLNPF